MTLEGGQLGVVGELVGGEVEQPAGDDRAAPPDLGDGGRSRSYR